MAFGTAAKARHSFHRQMFCSTDFGWVFTLQYFRGRTLLGVILSSTVNDLHLQRLQSIPFHPRTTARIPSADTLPGEQ